MFIPRAICSSTIARLADSGSKPGESALKFERGVRADRDCPAMSSATRKRPKAKARDRSPTIQLLGREPSASLFPSKNDLLKLFAVVTIAASVVAACNYAVHFFNRQDKPFCDNNMQLYDPNSDLCEPCPQNGLCSSGKLECFHGYQKQGRKCVEDGVINQTTKKLSELLKQHVCYSYGQVLCNERGKIWFQEADLLKITEEYMSNHSIDLKSDSSIFVKYKVMEIVQPIMETKTTDNRSKEFKCPDFLAELHKPLQCYVRQWIYKHLGIVVATFALLVGLTKLILRMHQKQKLTTRAEQLYEQVCEILQDNAIRTRSGDKEGEPWVVASWIRDQLLLPKERKQTVLWKKVEELILEDSRIDQYPKLIKGECKVVMEWQVDASLISMLKKKEPASRAKMISKIVRTHSNEEKKHGIADIANSRIDPSDRLAQKEKQFSLLAKLNALTTKKHAFWLAAAQMNHVMSYLLIIKIATVFSSCTQSRLTRCSRRSLAASSHLVTRCRH